MGDTDDRLNPHPHNEPTGKTAEAPAEFSAPPLRPGDRIGPYVLIDRLGAGSYGEVWKAEQKEPVRRHVAIKVLNAGMHSTAVVARFRAEQQALALMDHPGIAKVYDAGIAPSGLPYFVMQYVKGDTLLSHCDRERLTVTQRLELFASICDAVHHAHQKGIIHRDLKPSNIMVTTLDDGRAQPVVVDFGVSKATTVDFGVSKATTGTLTEETLHSVVGRPQGTWAYMSPEQADGLADMDTRSDIYSLGVVLYELLSGVRPFDDETFRQAGEEAKRRLIREAQPPSPGARFATERTASGPHVAENRRTSERELSRALSGELSWIPLYAIRKDPGRRYDSASQFAVDVRNYLEGRPLIAGPESTRYRVGKFIARNRLPATAAVAVVASLVVGLGATMWQARRADERAIAAERAERAERDRADQLQQVSDFQREMLAQVDPQAAGIALMADVRERLAAALERSGVTDEARQRRVAAFTTEWQQVNATDAAAAMIDRTILRPAVTTIEERFADQPEVDAQLRQALADVYRTIGLDDAALPLQESALRSRRATLGPDHPSTLSSVSAMGSLLIALGRADEAEPYYVESLAGRRRTLGENDPEALVAMSNMVFLLDSLGRSAEAEECARGALQRWRDAQMADDRRAIVALSNLSWVLRSRDKLAEAEVYSREAVERFQRVLGEGDPDTLQAQSTLGMLLFDRGDFGGAEGLFKAVLEGTRRMGDLHPRTLNALSNMGAVLRAQGKFAEAEPYLREALEQTRKLFGDEHEDTLISHNEMGSLLRDQGKGADAVDHFREAWSKGRSASGELHPLTLAFAFNLANLLLSLDQHNEAREVLESVGRAAEAEGADLRTPRLPRVLVLLARVQLGPGQTVERLRRAESLLLQVWEAIEAGGEGLRPLSPECIETFIDVYVAWDTMEPGHGQDQKAQAWTKRREADATAKSNEGTAGSP